MDTHYSRQFQRSDLPSFLKLVNLNAKARWPHVSYLLSSDIAWRLPGSAPKDNLRFWFDHIGLAAYIWFEPNAPMTFDLRMDLNYDHPIAQEMIDWCTKYRREFPAMKPWLLELKSMADWEQALAEEKPLEAGRSRYLQLGAFDTDEARIEFLQALGFEATEHFGFYQTRSLDVPIPEMQLPAGMHLRHVKEADFEQRVALHRDAWFRSTFTLQQYLKIRSIEVYEPTLDIVAEDKNGRFASYCIGWIDDELGVGSFEPVGTRPDYRRMGLAQQVNYEGLRRMKEMGMHSAKIGTAGFNHRAFALYTGCGFKLIDKERTYLKCID